MNTPQPQNVVTQLVDDLTAGRKVVIPSFDLPQAQAMKALLTDLSEHLRAMPTGKSVEDSIRQFIGKALGIADVNVIKVVSQGRHQFDQGFIVAAGTSQVTLTGNGVLLALGQASVVARGRATIFGTDNARLKLYDYSVASLSGSVQVNSYDYSSGIAEGTVRGVARNRSEWKLFGTADFDAFDNTFFYGREACSIRAYGSTKLIGRGQVRAQLFDAAHGWFTDESEIELYGSSIVYAEPTARTHILGSGARLMPLKDLASAWAA
ncbi:MAG: hypothetical protein R3F51_06990 [Cyanobacteriota/Melainabacteria group bacterium]